VDKYDFLLLGVAGLTALAAGCAWLFASELIGLATLLLGVWLTAVALAPPRSRIYRYLPTQLAQLRFPLSEEGWTEIEGQRLFTNIGWERRIADEQLANALAHLYHFNFYFRPVCRIVAARGTRVRWGRVPHGAHAVFEPRSNTITLGKHLMTESPTVLASILTHETSHAAFPERRILADYFQSECDAFHWEAETFRLLPAVEEETTCTLQIQSLLESVRSGSLAEYVLMNTEYQKLYLGGEIFDV
jgi:hypothetical protein